MLLELRQMHILVSFIIIKLSVISIVCNTIILTFSGHIWTAFDIGFVPKHTGHKAYNINYLIETNKYRQFVNFIDHDDNVIKDIYLFIKIILVIL